MSDVWSYIKNAMGPGLLWGKSKAEFATAIAQAEKDGRQDAADHLKILLEQRNLVMFD